MEVLRRRAAAPVRPPAAVVGGASVGGVQAGWQARGWRRNASGSGVMKFSGKVYVRFGEVSVLNVLEGCSPLLLKTEKEKGKEKLGAAASVGLGDLCGPAQAPVAGWPASALRRCVGRVAQLPLSVGLGLLAVGMGRPPIKGTMAQGVGGAPPSPRSDRSEKKKIAAPEEDAQEGRAPARLLLFDRLSSSLSSVVGPMVLGSACQLLKLASLLVDSVFQSRNPFSTSIGSAGARCWSGRPGAHARWAFYPLAMWEGGRLRLEKRNAPFLCSLPCTSSSKTEHKNRREEAPALPLSCML
ncbi:hypothetical protein ABZP36_000129 [Zizania latifolia]